MRQSGVEVDFEFGSILVTGQQSSYKAKVDRLAIDGKRNTIYLLSVVGNDSIIKGIRATLSGKRSGMTIRFSGLRPMLPDLTTKTLKNDPGNLPDCKFKVHHQKLSYGMIHAMFLAKDPDFLPNIGEESLWLALHSHRYTTPILRHWMPWLIAKLLRDKCLFPIYGHHCRCGRLDLTPDQLDRIVADGVRDGSLAITSHHERVSA